jgi:ankyrin repeat protein
MIAAQRHDLEKARALVEKGADVNLKTVNGLTALKLAKSGRSRDSAKQKSMIDFLTGKGSQG